MGGLKIKVNGGLKIKVNMTDCYYLEGAWTDSPENISRTGTTNS